MLQQQYCIVREELQFRTSGLDSSPGGLGVKLRPWDYAWMPLKAESLLEANIIVCGSASTWSLMLPSLPPRRGLPHRDGSRCEAHCCQLVVGRELVPSPYSAHVRSLDRCKGPLGLPSGWGSCSRESRTVSWCRMIALAESRLKWILLRCWCAAPNRLYTTYVPVREPCRAEISLRSLKALPSAGGFVKELLSPA